MASDGLTGHMPEFMMPLDFLEEIRSKVVHAERRHFLVANFLESQSSPYLQSAQAQPLTILQQVFYL
jgi:hypothetical protein